MAHVAFTTIPSIDKLAGATWEAGDNDSYEKTMARIPARQDIRLIGRKAKDGTVQLCYASNCSGAGEKVNGWHLTLAKFFMLKLEEAPAGDRLNVFFDRIDDPKAQHAAQQLIGLECGINVTKEPHGALHAAVQTVQASLRALGVPCGDWTFTPLFDGFETTSSAKAAA